MKPLCKKQNFFEVFLWGNYIHTLRKQIKHFFFPPLLWEPYWPKESFCKDLEFQLTVPLFELSFPSLLPSFQSQLHTLTHLFLNFNLQCKLFYLFIVFIFSIFLMRTQIPHWKYEEISQSLLDKHKTLIKFNSSLVWN